MKKLSFGTVLLAVLLVGTMASCKKEEAGLPTMPSYEKITEEPGPEHVTVEPGENEAYLDDVLSEVISLVDMNLIADCIGPLQTLSSLWDGPVDASALFSRLEDALRPDEEVQEGGVEEIGKGGEPEPEPVTETTTVTVETKVKTVAVLDVLSGDYVMEEIPQEAVSDEEGDGPSEELHSAPRRRKIEKTHRLVRRGDLPGAIRITMQDESQRTVCAVVKFSGALSETVVDGSLSLILPTHLELFLLREGVQLLSAQLDLADVPESKSVLVSKHVTVTGRALAGSTMAELTSLDLEFRIERYLGKSGDEERFSPALVKLSNLDLAVYGEGLYVAGVKGNVTITDEVAETIKDKIADVDVVREKRKSFVSTDLTIDLRHKLLCTVVLDRMHDIPLTYEQKKIRFNVEAYANQMNKMMNVNLYYGSAVQEEADAYLRYWVMPQDENGVFDTALNIRYATDSDGYFLDKKYFTIENFPKTYEQVIPIPILFQMLFSKK